MRYRRLGSSGLEISPLCLGCLAFGEPGRGAHEWTLDEERSRSILRQAIETGINFFDTANVYSDGASEEILGRAIRDFSRRDEVVIATKVHGRMRDGPNGAGLSRKAIFAAIDGSLKRLGTDYVDLYQIHRLDPSVPIEETLEALDAVVRAGKVLHLGASSMAAWQFATILGKQRSHGWARFVSMQNYLNLLYREEEREMLPLCRAEGIGVIPWSPLARGRLTRDWDESTLRSQTDIRRDLLGDALDADRRVAEEVAAVAAARGVPRAQVALAWVLAKAEVSAPIIGASKPSHLEDALAALDLRLEADEIAGLERHYIPHAVVGYR